MTLGFIITGNDCQDDCVACEESPCDKFVLSSQAVTERTTMTPVRRVPVALCFIVTGSDCDDDYDACE